MKVIINTILIFIKKIEYAVSSALFPNEPLLQYHKALMAPLSITEVLSFKISPPSSSINKFSSFAALENNTLKIFPAPACVGPSSENAS